MFFNMPKYHSWGRNKASECNEVTILSDQSNRAICNYCKEKIIIKIGRVKNYLDKCRRKKKRSAMIQQKYLAIYQF